MSTARLIPAAAAAEEKTRSVGDMKMARKPVPEGQIREPLHRPVSDKVVLLRTANMYEGSCTEWYMIGIDHDDDALIDNTNKDILVSPALVGAFGCASCWSIIGSTLYIIGGRIRSESPCKPDPYCRDVLMFNATHPHHWFIHAPPMIRERCWGVSVAHDGKLFMFGGTYGDDDHWGEYFDPKLNKWNPIPQPPFDLPTAHYLFAIPFDNKHVMVGSQDKRVLLYNTQFHYWQRFPHPIYPDVLTNPNNCVKVGNVVYWLIGRLYAYDLETQKSYSALVKGSDLQYEERRYARNPNIHPTPLFHCRGNVFCYIWYDLIGTEPHWSTALYCEKIRVVLDPSGHLDVTPISTQPYIADHPLQFVDAELLDREFVENFISKTEEMFSGSSSAGKDERSYASALMTGLERLSIMDSSATGGKQV